MQVNKGAETVFPLTFHSEMFIMYSKEMYSVQSHQTAEERST